MDYISKSQKQLRRIITILSMILLFIPLASATITVNPSQDIGVVNDYFYGVNTHGTWGSEGSQIDTSGDGISDTLSDYEWHRDKLTEAKIKYIRADMNLNNLIFGIQSKDAENWQDNTTTLIGGTKSITGYPVGWDFEIVGAGSIGTVSKSFDSHSGQYSVNITNTGTGSAFSNIDMQLPQNHVYNFSTWIKSSNAVSISIQREDTWTNACKTTSSGSNSWEYLTCIANITDNVPEGWRLVIQTNSGQNLLWDDMNFKQDNSDYDLIPDLSKQKSLVSWAYQNNIKVLFIASYMPEYLANITSDCISDTKTCPSKNLTEWSNNVVKYITEVTEQGLYANSVEVEVWNEPDLSQFWLSNVGGTNSKRAQLYGQLYGATYDAIKSQYPDMKVGGPAVTGHDTDSELILRNVIQNYSFDFLSYHKYLGQGGSPYYDIALTDDLAWIYGLCSAYNKNCPRILLDEWNVWDSSIKLNNESYWKMQLSLAYASLLNNYPENITTAEYQWSESTSYDNAAVYPEYPQRWSMVSEPLLDNQVYSSFNITKDFTTYHGAGSRIISSSSSDSKIVAVASVTGTHTYLTIINKNATTANVTIIIAGNDFNYIKDLQTGLNDTINSSVSIGAFGVKHYELLNIAEEITPEVNATISDINLNGNITLLNCSGRFIDDNTSLPVTINFIKDDVIVHTDDFAADNNTEFSRTLEGDYGDWKCTIEVQDEGLVTDTSNILSFTAPVEETPADLGGAGGNGGSGGSIDGIYIDESGSNHSSNRSNSSKVASTAVAEDVQKDSGEDTMKAPILEQPTLIRSNLVIYLISFGLMIVIISTLTTLFLLKRDNIPTDEAMIGYIEQALDAGYNKAAIKTALRVKFSSRIINHHLRLVNKKQNIRYTTPVDDNTVYDQTTIEKVKEYVSNQKRHHFRDVDIREVLLHYGYSKKLINQL